MFIGLSLPLPRPEEAEENFTISEDDKKILALPPDRPLWYGHPIQKGLNKLDSGLQTRQVPL